jgi:metal-responsive CopG/Arc/MetJ family transcriptional regulator
MKTIQMTIDESLLEQVDSAVRELGTTRSAFMRKALLQALKQLQIAVMEQQHIAGYERYPVEPGEFDVWETEQVWEEVA